MKPGTQVTLSCRLTVSVGEYTNIHPSASVTITLSEDPAKDVEDLRKEVRRLFLVSLADEVELLQGIKHAKDVGGLKAVKDFANGRSVEKTTKIRRIQKIEADGSHT